MPTSAGLARTRPQVRGSASGPPLGTPRRIPQVKWPDAHCFLFLSSISPRLRASAQTRRRRPCRAARCRRAAGRRHQDRVGSRDQGHHARQRHRPSVERRRRDHPLHGVEDRRQDVRQLGDASGKPASFRVVGVIAGFSEGLQLMVVGEKRRLWIPEALAYKGAARAEGDARVRHRAARHPDPRAGRRQGAAGRREENARAASPTKCCSRASADVIRDRPAR